MYFPSLENTDGLVELTACSDGCFIAGKNGVGCIAATGDGKLELIAQENRTLCYEIQDGLSGLLPFICNLF